MMSASGTGLDPRPAPSLNRLSEGACGKIFDASLEILERTGVRLHDQGALDLLAGAGVKAEAGNRVRIPYKLVENALKTAPKRIALYDRYGKPAMEVEGHCAYFGPGSDCLYIIDHRDGKRRRAMLQDVVEGMTLVDALPHIDFAMCMFQPEEVPQTSADRYQMEAMLNYTTKPVFYVTTDFSGCLDAIEMAEVVAGGERQLQQCPLAACYINVTTALNHNAEALQKLRFLAGKGLPCAYIPSTQGGMTSPVTLAGTLALSQAGALVGLVLSQLINEGAPVFLPGWGGNMLDMRTMVQPYSDPEKRILAVDLRHFLELPMFSLAGCSDSKCLDSQAGIEAGLTLMGDRLAGAQVVHDLGYLESGLTGSLSQLLICNEILSWLEAFTSEIEVSDRTLALDLIDEVGPDGQFLDSEHTYQHYRERWYPELFDRGSYDLWMDSGGAQLGERADQRVQEILDQHRPEQLEAELRDRVHQVVERSLEAL